MKSAQSFVLMVLVLGMTGSFARGNVVTDWNDVLLQAIRTDRTPPTIASRAMAIVHIAIYDAVNGIMRTHEAYHVSANAPNGASIEAAAIAAAHATLAALFPAQSEKFDDMLDDGLDAIPEGQSRLDGIAWG